MLHLNINLQEIPYCTIMAQSGSLPTVDISPYLTYPPTETYTSTVSKTNSSLLSALHNPGFFYLTNHGIPTSVTDEILSLAKEFFTTIPEAEKNEIKRLPAGKGIEVVASSGVSEGKEIRFGDGARGYQALRENITKGKRDGHEAIDWYRFIVASRTSNLHLCSLPSSGEEDTTTPPYQLLQGPNLYPANPKEFKEVYENYVDKMLELGTAVVRAMGYALDLKNKELLVEMTREGFWVMRAIGYPPLSPSLPSASASQDEEEEISCGEHTDYGCLTLLLMDGTKKALQVKLTQQDGSDRWQDIEPIRGAYVVNVGDMVELFTGGVVKSTRHRVVHRDGTQGYRVSVPFFFEPDRDAMVEVLEEFRSEENKGWKGVRYWDHLVGKVGGNFYGGGGE